MSLKPGLSHVPPLCQSFPCLPLGWLHFHVLSTLWFSNPREKREEHSGSESCWDHLGLLPTPEPGTVARKVDALVGQSWPGAPQVDRERFCSERGCVDVGQAGPRSTVPGEHLLGVGGGGGERSGY